MVYFMNLFNPVDLNAVDQHNVGKFNNSRPKLELSDNL